MYETLVFTPDVLEDDLLGPGRPFGEALIFDQDFGILSLRKLGRSGTLDFPLRATLMGSERRVLRTI